jgi:hypothetical protein
MPAAIIFALSEMLQVDPDFCPDTGREKLPELKLIAAILEDAIELIQGKPCKSLAEEKARRWRGLSPIAIRLSRLTFAAWR